MPFGDGPFLRQVQTGVWDREAGSGYSLTLIDEVDTFDLIEGQNPRQLVVPTSEHSSIASRRRRALALGGIAACTFLAFLLLVQALLPTHGRHSLKSDVSNPIVEAISSTAIAGARANELLAQRLHERSEGQESHSSSRLDLTLSFKGKRHQHGIEHEHPAPVPELQRREGRGEGDSLSVGMEENSQTREDEQQARQDDNFKVDKDEDLDHIAGDAHVSERYPATASDNPLAAPPIPDIIKGVCYAPVPFRSPRQPLSGHQLPDDDFMSDYTSSLWSSEGRGDLKVIRSLGANAVRLYGNDAGLSKRRFLDEALEQRLYVIAGLSDYPYLQMPGNCAHNGLNCYEQVKEAYKANLDRGFSVKRTDGKRVYHPALLKIILMNEPDLKFLPPGYPEHFSRALVSAFDAVLDAEKEYEIEGLKPNFTVTFSFGICFHCTKFNGKPALGQMYDLRRAMKDPKLVNYTARNNLWEAYRERFENSFNTANEARSLGYMFMKPYAESFQSTPVFIAEYHSPSAKDLESDLRWILRMAARPGSLFKGISFFEFQSRYDKGGAEMAFGLFGLGKKRLGTLSVSASSREYVAWCLSPLAAPRRIAGCPRSDRDAIYVEETLPFGEDEETWTMELGNVGRSDECCSKCVSIPVCKSWTWTGTSCRFSAAEPPKKPKKAKGMVSGLSSHRPRIAVPGISGGGDEEIGFPPMPLAVSAAFGGIFPRDVPARTLCPATAVQYF